MVIKIITTALTKLEGFYGFIENCKDFNDYSFLIIDIQICEVSDNQQVSYKGKR